MALTEEQKRGIGNLSDAQQYSFNDINYAAPQKVYPYAPAPPTTTFNSLSLSPEGSVRDINYKPQADISARDNGLRSLAAPQKSQAEIQGLADWQVVRQKSGWDEASWNPSHPNYIYKGMQQPANPTNSQPGALQQNPSTIQRPQGETVQTIRGDVVSNQNFSPSNMQYADGTPVQKVTTYDEAGNLLSRQDLEQRENMRIVRDAMERASMGDPRAVRGLQAIGGLKSAETGIDALKGTASARRDSVASDLAPDIAAASNASSYAHANKAEIESRLLRENNKLNQEHLAAQTWALRNPQLTKTTRDTELERDRIATASADRALAADPFADWNAAYARARNPVAPAGKPGSRESAAALLKQANPKATQAQIDAALKSRGF